MAQIIFFLALFLSASLDARVVEYHLKVAPKKIQVTNFQVDALAINDQIPAPTIYADVGDILRIHVENNLNEETSLHWHGVLLPNRMDGVPYVTTPPILPGKTFVYEFPVTHKGTYWYHSHSGLQEQKGLLGAIVFRDASLPKDDTITREHILVLSDWTNEDPHQILKNLKKTPEFYAQKKTLCNLGTVFLKMVLMRLNFV